MLDVRGYPDFATASREVLKFLRDRIGFDLWMITRVIDQDWIVLQAEDHGYGVHAGDVFSWADSFCFEMVQGNGPYIAPQSDLVAVYRQAPINQQIDIGAYAGLPLCDKEGRLFGTLCGIHPKAFPDSLMEELPIVELIARLLGSLLDAELNTQQERRRAERAEAEAQIDTLTGLYNRRGWDKLVAAEDIRCQHFGYSACIIVVDLDHFKQVNDTYGHITGDEYLQRAAHTLLGVLRKEDVAARIGGDEFAILGIEVERQGAQALVERLAIALEAAHIDASLGYALRHPAKSLREAWAQADTAMYRRKQRKRTTALASVVSPP
ncbi:MAG TPA: sensor domain-containing diguanylate cyclase [Candidatus Obscuribacterales bacterium]